MAYIKLSTPEQGVIDGMELTFKAPCDGSGISGVTLDGENYQFVSTLGESITCSNNMFKSGAYITITINTVDKTATIITNNEAYAREQVARLDQELDDLQTVVNDTNAEVEAVKDGTTVVGNAENVTGSIGGMKLEDVFYREDSSNPLEPKVNRARKADELSFTDSDSQWTRLNDMTEHVFKFSTTYQIWVKFWSPFMENYRGANHASFVAFFPYMPYGDDRITFVSGTGYDVDRERNVSWEISAGAQETNSQYYQLYVKLDESHLNSDYCTIYYRKLK